MKTKPKSARQHHLENHLDRSIHRLCEAMVGNLSNEALYYELTDIAELALILWEMDEPKLLNNRKGRP